MMPASITAVVVVGGDGDDHALRCIEALVAQMSDADELVLVRRASEAATPRGSWAGDTCVLWKAEPATKAQARRAGGRAATRDIVAFVDDDALVTPGWVAHIRSAYADASVCGVAGRVEDGSDGERERGLGEIGRLLADGRTTFNFAADPPGVIEVDHLPSASFSFRRTSLEQVGGLDARFGNGEAVVDASLRIRRSGGRLLFTPAAVAVRPGGPTDIGRDSPRRHRDRIAMLMTIDGPGSPAALYYALGVVRAQRQRVVEAAMLVTPYWGRSDGSRRPLRRRLQAGIPLLDAARNASALIHGAVDGMIRWIFRPHAIVLTRDKM